MEANHPELAPDISSNGDSGLVVPAIINGNDEILDTAFDVVSPYVGISVWKASDADIVDAIRCVECAQAAFPVWSSTHPKERRRILLKAADLIEQRAESISAIMRTEMGANYGASSGFITPASVEWLRDMASRTTSIQGRVTQPEVEGQSAIVRKIPVGVVLSIVPWNAPPVFSSRALGAPLAAGCTVVVKSSEITPRTYYTIAKCYLDAGVPPGAINMITCRPQSAPKVTTAMIEHPAVRKVHFTGSTSVGRKIATTCALNLKPCIMELGGKNAAIVLDDANLETAAVQCVLGSFINSGQTCMCTDRIIVQSKIADQFQATFSAVLSKIFPSEIAPPALVGAAAKERLEALVAEAKEKGGSILAGGWTDNDINTNGSIDARFKQGVFMRPVVVKNTTAEMRIWSEEIFGMAVAMTTVDSEEEAIELANSSEYGLAAAIFTEDLRRGIRVADAIEAGQIHINSMTVQDEPAIPFGGVKASGWGRFHNKEGMEEFLTTKSITWMD